MDSPKQARPTSNPKKVTLEAGFKPANPISSTSRCTPTSKTKPKIYPGARCNYSL